MKRLWVGLPESGLPELAHLSSILTSRAMRPIYAALVVAVLAVLFAWLQRSDTAGSMGPPPRLVLSRPILVECEDRLKKVRIRTNDMPSREFLLAAYVMVTIFDVMPGMGVVK